MRTGIIYRATNLTNGKCYIGQTTGGLHRRCLAHLNESKRIKSGCYNTLFSRALRKYGFENFKWEVLYENISKDQLNLAEICAVYGNDSFYDGYNLTAGGDGGLGCIPNSEIRRKMSLAQKGKKKYRPNGILATEKTKNKMATKRKMFWNKNGKNFLVFKNEQLIGKWNSQIKCAKDLNLNNSAISHCLLGEHKTHGGYIFKYV